MALGHSPQIVTNGLVFAYDMANLEKSWKGAPTTNLISNPRNLANGRVATASCGSSFTDFATGGPTDGPFVRVTRITTAGITGDWAWDISYPSIAIGTTFKFSCYARSTNNTVSTIEFSNPDAEEVSFTLTPEWQRFSTTFTSGIQSNLQFMRINRSNANDKTIGSIYDVADAQIEVSPITTPFVNGTRSNTQAIIDLTNNNTITANSLTYNANNSFKFNGTSNFLNCGSNSAINLTTEISIETWFNAETTGGGIVTYGSTLAEQYALWATENKIMFSTSWPSPWQLAYSTTISIDTWYHAVATFKNGAWKIYKNGVLDTSGTFAVTTLPAASGGYLLIGNNHPGGQEYFKGQIPVVKIYNRELLAAEVKQNFNALRGRYGL